MNDRSEYLLRKYKAEILQVKSDGFIGLYSIGNKRTYTTRMLYKADFAARQGLLTVLRKLEKL